MNTKPVIRVVLNVVAIFCLGWAWFMAAGWFVNPGNYWAWLAGGLTAFAASHLPWRR